MTPPPAVEPSASSPDSVPAADPGGRPLPPVLGRLLRGSFWLALRSPLQVIFALWSVPLILGYLGDDRNGAYYFAWGFGFIQFLLEFGMSSALQRQVSDAWARGDRPGVDRAIACGTAFYAAVAVIQASALLAIAYGVLPFSGYEGESYRLIVKLLWLQAITAPCFGLSAVVSSVLQAARRYDFIPRFELLIVIFRFLILVGGVTAGINFFWIVVAQVAMQVGLSLGPGLWVMRRELGFVPHIRGANLSDFRVLLRVSIYVFLIQLSVVLADRIDTTILGFALPEGVAGKATTVYNNVSKPFVQIRQTGWMLSYLVMPAVASLAAARNLRELERIKYDGSRLLIGLLLPVALLAGIYAGPFLGLWVGPRFASDAWLLRLFLVATLPLAISVLVQTAIGIGKIEVIAIAALIGALVNLPLSYALTLRFGDASGVIWGTVLTTLFSNLLVPAVYVFRVLEVDARLFLTRTLGPPLTGALALGAASWTASLFIATDPTGASGAARALPPLLLHLTAGSLAYLAGYLAIPSGRADLATLTRKVRSRVAATS